MKSWNKQHISSAQHSALHIASACWDGETGAGGTGEQDCLSKAALLRKAVSKPLSQTESSWRTAGDTAAWGSRKERRQLYSVKQKQLHFWRLSLLGHLESKQFTAKWDGDKKPRDQRTGLRTHSGSPTSAGGVLGVMAAVWHAELHPELEVWASRRLWTGSQELILFNFTHHPVWEQTGITQRAVGKAWCSLYPLPSLQKAKGLPSPPRKSKVPHRCHQMTKLPKLH